MKYKSFKYSKMEQDIIRKYFDNDVCYYAKTTKINSNVIIQETITDNNNNENNPFKIICIEYFSDCDNVVSCFYLCNEYRRCFDSDKIPSKIIFNKLGEIISQYYFKNSYPTKIEKFE